MRENAVGQTWGRSCIKRICCGVWLVFFFFFGLVVSYMGIQSMAYDTQNFHPIYPCSWPASALISC
jgi:hypothetical protein